MNDSDKKSFSESIGVLGIAMGTPVTDAILTTYWEFLRDMEVADFKRAVGMAGRTLKFFPRPAELRELALGNPAETKKLNAANAWEVVRHAMDKYDYTHSVDFGPLTNAVVRNLGGWLWLCGRTLNDLTFDRKKFEEVHQSLAGTSVAADRSEPLPGQFAGKPVFFQIPGEPERRLALPEVESPGLALVRDLADKKAAG